MINNLVAGANGVDSTPPYVEQQNPKPDPEPNTQNAPIYTNIVLVIKDAGNPPSGVDYSSIMMKVNNAVVSPKMEPVGSSDCRVTYEPSTYFAPQTNIQVSVIASDFAGNRMTTAYSYSFTTQHLGEGFNVIADAALYNSGYRGAGVKVGIMAEGFSSYSSLLGTELPNSVNTHWSTLVGGEGSSRLGTLAAEIITDFAPQASLYLTNFVPYNDIQSQDWLSAADWLIQQHVDIILNLESVMGASDGKGTGIVNEKATEAWNNGILWVQPSGDTVGVWNGVFQDNNRNKILEWKNSDEYNSFRGLEQVITSTPG